MFAIPLLSIGLALAAPQGAGGRGANPAPDATVVEISARLIQADGKPSAGASKSGADNFSGYLWSNAQCAVGGGESAPSATTGWKFNTNIVRHLADSVTVQVVWQRVGDPQNQGTIDRTMRVGDRVQIDRIDLGATCASAVQLEATVLRSSASTGAGGRGGFGARGGRGVGAGSDVSGAATAAGAARARGSLDPQSLQAQEEMRKTLQARAAEFAARAQGAAGGRGGRGVEAGMYTAELWLVHTVPNSAPTSDAAPASRGGRGAAGGGARGGAAGGRSTTPPSQAGPGEVEKVTYQMVRFAPTGAGFALPPVSVATSKGPASIVVMGTLSATVENGVPTKLVVTVNRQAMGSEQPAGTTGRSSTKEVPWPQSGEVISFELPPTAADTQEKLAIRLRVFGGSLAGAARGRMR